MVAENEIKKFFNFYSLIQTADGCANLFFFFFNPVDHSIESQSTK